VIVVASTNPQLYIACSYLPPYDTLEQDLTPIGTFLTAVKLTNFIRGLDATANTAYGSAPPQTTGENNGELRNNTRIDYSKRKGQTYIQRTDRSKLDRHHSYDNKVGPKCSQLDS